MIYHLLVQQNRQSRSTPNDHNKVVKIKVMLQTIRCLKHYLTLSEDIYTCLCDSPHDHKDVVYHREYTLQKPGVMCAEVARIMGRTILSEDIQVSPPNHPVAFLNWWSLTLMLAEQLATNRKLSGTVLYSGSLTGRSRSSLHLTLTVIYASSNSGRPPLKTGV